MHLRDFRDFQHMGTFAFPLLLPTEQPEFTSGFQDYSNEYRAESLPDYKADISKERPKTSSQSTIEWPQLPGRRYDEINLEYVAFSSANDKSRGPLRLVHGGDPTYTSIPLHVGNSNHALEHSLRSDEAVDSQSRATLTVGAVISFSRKPTISKSSYITESSTPICTRSPSSIQLSRNQSSKSSKKYHGFGLSAFSTVGVGSNLLSQQTLGASQTHVGTVLPVGSTEQMERNPSLAKFDPLPIGSITAQPKLRLKVVNKDKIAIGKADSHVTKREVQSMHRSSLKVRTSQNNLVLGFMPRLGGKNSKLKVYPELTENKKNSMLSATAQRSSSNLTIENRESSSHMKSPSLLNYLGSISSPPGWRRSFSTISIGDDIKTLVSSKTEHKETPSGPEKPVKKLTFVQKIFRKGVKTVLSNLITYKRSKSNYKTMYERWQHEKIEWGIICILSGFIQSILVGCIESYILWSVYKFTMLSWGDYKGSSQFILTYMSLFICAQFVFTFLLVDAAWKKNSLQVGVCQLLNFGSLSYVLIQRNRIASLKACSTSFLAVYAATPTPSIYTNTATQTTPFQAPNASLSTLYLSNANGSVYFDLMADCPWTIDDRTVKRLTDSLNLISVTDSFQSAILALCVIGCFCSLMFGWKAISEYKWKIFELQGASLRRRYMILRYHFFLVLIKINLFFMFSIVTMIVSASYYSAEQQSNKYAVLSAQYYFYSSQSPGYLIPQSMIPSFASTAPFSTTLIPSLIVTLFVAIILFALGWHAIHRTNVAAMVVFLFFIVGDLAAVGYVINLVNTNSSFDSTRLIVMLLAYIQCITDICILCTGIMSIRDFNQGLKIMLNAQKILATSDPDLFQRAKPRTKAVLD